MTVPEIAHTLVKMCSERKFEEAMKTLYAPDIVSVEPGAGPGRSREQTGLEAALVKGAGFDAAHEIHSFLVEGPLVAGPYFAVTMKMDATFKPENRKFHLEEIGVYKVANGKIVREEFFYSL